MNQQFAWYQNISIWTAFAAWFFAQGVKLFTHFVNTHKIDFRYLVSTGGMPSAHSAMASALATSIAFTSGMKSPLFAVTAAFAVVVMFDAQTVRHAAGLQARLLNQIVDEALTEHHFSHEKLRELLGHTPLEVFLGMLVGILVALIVHFNFG